MTKCNVSSSDLALARSLSRRLVGQVPSATDPDDGVPEAAYTRFRVAGGPSPAPAEASAPVGEWVPLEMDTWETLLAWSLEMCQAQSAFVVDSEGFVIGFVGSQPLSTQVRDAIVAQLAFNLPNLR